MYKSYAVTVRPRNGLSDLTMSELAKWVAKQDYGVLVIESESESRHAHLQVWFNEGRERGKITTAMQRICDRTIEDFDNAQLKVLRSGVKIAYSDWYADYLIDNKEKEDSDGLGEVVYIKVPDNPLEFYPTEEDQQKVQDKVNAVDKYYHKLLELWNEWWYGGPVMQTNVASFLADMEFKSKKITVIRDNKTRHNTCRNLYHYIEGHADASNYMPVSNEQ